MNEYKCTYCIDRPGEPKGLIYSCHKCRDYSDLNYDYWSGYHSNKNEYTYQELLKMIRLKLSEIPHCNLEQIDDDINGIINKINNILEPINEGNRI
jgi:hypothetical protein